MYKQIIALTLLATVSYAQIVGWTDCGTTGATIQSINVGQCSQVPCTFVRNNTYEIRILATALASSTDLPFNVTALFFGLEVTVMSGNICEHLTCPTSAGQSIDFGYSYTVSNDFPPIPSTVRTSVWNQANELSMCFSFPMQIA